MNLSVVSNRKTMLKHFFGLTVHSVQCRSKLKMTENFVRILNNTYHQNSVIQKVMPIFERNYVIY